MRVLVCGGRDFSDWKLLKKVLDECHLENGITLIIEGGANGADYLAKCWATERDILWEEYRAEWDKYGDRAGPLRNKRMIELGKPHLVIAFPGGKGTANMLQQAQEANIETWEIRYGD